MGKFRNRKEWRVGLVKFIGAATGICICRESMGKYLHLGLFVSR